MHGCIGTTDAWMYGCIEVSLSSLRAKRSNPVVGNKIMEKKGFVYILFSKKNGTLYTGVTSNLVKRIYEHKQKLVEGFTKKYNIDKLGYFEIYESIEQAIEREKQIKAGSRKKKIALIEKENSDWKDLYNSIL